MCEPTLHTMYEPKARHREVWMVVMHLFHMFSKVQMWSERSISNLKDSTDSCSQLLAIEIGRLQTTASLSQCRNADDEILKAVFLVYCPYPIFYHLYQPDKT